MASNLDYLDPALIPLEKQVDAFLEAQKALGRAKIALQNPASQRPAAESHATAEQLQRELTQLEQAIIEMLPTRNEWLKVNLGYGPSRVGAWHVPAQPGAPERYELRVIH